MATGNGRSDSRIGERGCLKEGCVLEGVSLAMTDMLPNWRQSGVSFLSRSCDEVLFTSALFVVLFHRGLWISSRVR